MSRAAPPVREARVRALAKINLDLRVLGKRPDGYHELRTVFQTISLSDTIRIAFTPSRETRVELNDPLRIPGNLALQAAELVLDAARTRGRVAIGLTKRIPMGAGLGGGSSDAAAVLLALPVLAGFALPLPRVCELAAALGSDVPFFLLGGTAAGVGRGGELFPLPDRPSPAALLVAPGLHVSTPEAYRRLSPRLTTESQQNKIFSFQSLAWDGGVSKAACNDFEAVVFQQYPQLARLKRRLQKAGAFQVLMTGSGSAIFGLFRTDAEACRARSGLAGENALRISLVTRARYRSLWWRALGQHIDQKIWPPRSRYAR
ncbi:MAG: 4-(cytidine 5'-diphospho)-2-C-methyl-D-erythritol kinase [Terriglobia bacterium]|nr:MAG: 4-(cytidine 5'-diphospho)-2-C-methyl-D-erythritol kinase [Terriglobia bacterium]